MKPTPSELLKKAKTIEAKLPRYRNAVIAYRDVIFELRDNKHLTLLEIVKFLNENGITTNIGNVKNIYYRKKKKLENETNA